MTLIALATAICAVVSLLGIAAGFRRSFADVYRSHSVDIVVSRQGASDRLSSSLDEASVARIRDVPGVDRVAAVLLETLSLESQQLYGVPTMGVPASTWLLNDYEISGGKAITELAPRSILLGQNLSGRAALAIGDEVSLFDETFRVGGVFTSRSTWENGSMILRLDDLQWLTGRAGQVTYANVVVRPEGIGGEIAEITRRIMAVDAKLLAMPTEDFVATDTRMQIAGAMAWMTSVVAILIGSIAALNTMMTSVIERTGEIGILRAIGWSRRRVVMMILGESFVLAILATLIGCVLAVGLTHTLSRTAAVGGVLEATIPLQIAIRGAAIGMAIGLLGACLPAVRAAKLLPTDAFRDLN